MTNDYYESIEIIMPKHQKKSQKKKEKSKRKVYHVVPCHGSMKKKIWKVKLEGRSTAANGIFPSKKRALSRARELAKKAKLGQVIVHKLDGTIQTEYTYGKDPRNIKG
jgi:hypothetical protein